MSSSEASQRPLLTDRFTEAVALAAQLHRKQTRKGTTIPYMSHLLGVTSLVLEHGGDEDQAIAAVLHDAVEDQGGRATLERIREKFGERVAFIVEGCTDSDTQEKAEWRTRKEAYLHHLASTPVEVLLVSASDKLHNARAILSDFRELGDELFNRFKGGKQGTLWYYRSLVTAFDATSCPPRLVRALDEVVTSIERESGNKPGA